MKDFFDNVSRWPRYLISFTLGIFFANFQWLKALTSNRTSAIALVGIAVTIVFLVTFTLRAMLGFVETGLTPLPIADY